ncbi:uncharacterized protein LOC130635687 [Hydractinia symbiolongicarpus]|uniref:uncharacterized protein LOC130635687 n=1 Tax=Hydractinia symbiolongicarpus TaxID=13093 RepID=UPI00254CB281|nr:uncharacterized protein LOC130635687 [Hydractinia symbiolongicarpus]
MNNANVKASTGDTVVLGWQFDLNADIRKETLEIFYCGYKDKIDGHLKPLVYTSTGDDFLSLNLHTVPPHFGLKVDQENTYIEHVHAHKNLLRNAFYMTIKNIDADFDHLDILCVLNYKTPFAKDTAQGGVYTIQVKRKATAENREKLSKVRFGQTFFGAVIFVILLSVLAWVGAIKWKQREKGYKPVPTTDSIDKNKGKEKQRKLTRPPTPVKPLHNSKTAYANNEGPSSRPSRPSQPPARPPQPKIDVGKEGKPIRPRQPALPISNNSGIKQALAAKPLRPPRPVPHTSATNQPIPKPRPRVQPSQNNNDQNKTSKGAIGLVKRPVPAPRPKK